MPDMPGMSKQNRRLSTSWRPTIWGCWRDASAEARLRRQAKKRGGNTIPNAQRTWHKSHGSKSFHYQQASVHRRTRTLDGRRCPILPAPRIQQITNQIDSEISCSSDPNSLKKPGFARRFAQFTMSETKCEHFFILSWRVHIPCQRSSTPKASGSRPEKKACVGRPWLGFMEGMTILGSLIAKSCSRWLWTGIFSKL